MNYKCKMSKGPKCNVCVCRFLYRGICEKYHTTLRWYHKLHQHDENIMYSYYRAWTAFYGLFVSQIDGEHERWVKEKFSGKIHLSILYDQYITTMYRIPSLYYCLNIIIVTKYVSSMYT